MSHDDRSDTPGPREGPKPENIDVERLKQSIRLSDVVSRYTQLRPSGRSRIGLCPFHHDTNPSLVVTDDIGSFYCHGCRARGDVINFVMDMHRLTFLEAIRYISGAFPALAIPYERERARKLDRAKRALAGAYARDQWSTAKVIEGTPAEVYLRSRGITCHLPSTLRFGVVPIWISLNTGRKSRTCPALIAACQNKEGRITGIQRIFLDWSGRRAALAKPKLGLGPIKGGALRLGELAAEMVVCEGPEDGLTLHQMLPNTPVWVALGSGNMPSMILPDTVRRVLVAGDNNPSGRQAAQDACEVFRSQGRNAAPVFPAAEFEDFNDQLRGVQKLDMQEH